MPATTTAFQLQFSHGSGTAWDSTCLLHSLSEARNTVHVAVTPPSNRLLIWRRLGQEQRRLARSKEKQIERSTGMRAVMPHEDQKLETAHTHAALPC